MQNEAQFIKEHLSDVAPVPCDFKVGDVVTFTNEYGVSFPNNKIIGFSKELFYGKFIHTSNEAYWFPKSPESLTK